VTTITIGVHPVAPATMPDADTDVLIWTPGEHEGQLGAYVGPEISDTGWVDAHGDCASPTHWAEMPRLPAVVLPMKARDLLPLADGRAVDLGARWVLPT